MTDAAEPGKYTPAQLVALAEELDRVAPRLGPSMAERLFRGRGVHCFSFRQLTLFLGGAMYRAASDSGREPEPSWLPEPVVKMIDDAIVRPLAQLEPPIVARSPEEFLHMIADWLRGAADEVGADATPATVRLGGVDVDRSTLVGLIAKLAVREVLQVGEVVRERLLVRRLAILAGMPRVSEPRERRSRNVAHRRSGPRERR